MVPFAPEKGFVSLDGLQIQLPTFSNGQITGQCNTDIENNSTSVKKTVFDHSSLHSHISPYANEALLHTHSRPPDIGKRSKGRKNLECPYCLKKFRYRGNMVVHERTHTGERRYKCPTCMKRFSKRQNLQSHIRVHTGEQPYKCNECGKKFARQNNLARHKVIHSGKKEHACTFCDKKFVSKSNLRSHLIIHSERKLHKCPYCLKTYKGGNYFKKHIQKHKDAGDQTKQMDEQVKIEQTTPVNQQPLVAHSQMIYQNPEPTEPYPNPVEGTVVMETDTPTTTSCGMNVLVSEEERVERVVGGLVVNRRDVDAQQQSPPFWMDMIKSEYVEAEEREQVPPLLSDEEASSSSAASSRSTSPEPESPLQLQEEDDIHMEGIIQVPPLEIDAKPELDNFKLPNIIDFETPTLFPGNSEGLVPQFFDPLHNNVSVESQKLLPTQPQLPVTKGKPQDMPNIGVVSKAGPQIGWESMLTNELSDFSVDAELYSLLS